MKSIDEFVEQNAQRYVDELKQFLRIPSVSADSQRVDDLQQAAEFVRDSLADAGFDTEIVPTPGHPIVYASWLEAGDDAPTVLVYGHYDVQPPDPLDEWKTPPFEPDIRDGYIYARGATDDKGQMYTHVKSVEAWMKTEGRLPVNVKFVIEGEEEVGSNNLENFLEQNRDQVACDVAVISDTSQFAPGVPAITYGLRGILACEVKLSGPAQDLHSGVFGGSIANPINALAKLIGGLQGDDGRCTLPGFYDNVVPLTETEREQFAALPFDEQRYLKDIGTDAPFGEAGFSTLERRWARPTFDVNGFHGGYGGEGPKTIVPAAARAKITCRLVPDQDAAKLTRAMKDYFEANCPPGLRVTFTDYHGCGALVFDTQSPYMSAAQSAIETAFGAPPVLIREGGSIPVVATFQKILGVDTLLLGWGQNSDNLHSPNERFSLADYHRGIRASCHLWDELAKQRKSR